MRGRLRQICAESGRRRQGDAPRAPRDALREAAKRATAACTVLETEADEAFYDGAGLQHSRYERTTRGIRIVAMPDLIPDPPLKPPRRRDGHHVLVADPELAATAEEKRGAAGAAWSESDPVYWLEKAEKAGEEPSFPVQLALPSLSRRIGDPKLRLERAWRNVHLNDLRGTNPTVIWTGDGRFLVTGRAARALEEAIDAPEIRTPGSDIARLLDLVERRNPFRAQALAEMTAAVADNKMLNGEDLLREWRWELIGTDARCRVLAVDRSAERAARQLLSTVANREWRGLKPALRLRAAARAELVLLAPVGRRDAVHVVANMGAGRLLEIRVMKFEDEPLPLAAFELQGDSWRLEAQHFDGGDVHIMMSPFYDEMLEGERLVPRERRREEEARAADD